MKGKQQQQQQQQQQKNKKNKWKERLGRLSQRHTLGFLIQLIKLESTWSFIKLLSL